MMLYGQCLGRGFRAVTYGGSSSRGLVMLVDQGTTLGRASAAPQQQQQRGRKKIAAKDRPPRVIADEELRKKDEEARQEYRAKMRDLRLDCIQETTERQAEDMRRKKLTYALMQKEKAALRHKKNRRRAEGLAKAARVHQEDKDRYEAGYRRAERILNDRRSRSAEHHAMLIQELEYESQFWTKTPEEVNERITDHIWYQAGASSHGGEITMPGEKLWRFTADAGLPDPEEEPLEQGFVKLQMHERLQKMRDAKQYVQERRRRWANDTRNVTKEMDRLSKKGGAPQGWLDNRRDASSDSDSDSMEGETTDSDSAEDDTPQHGTSDEGHNEADKEALYENLSENGITKEALMAMTKRELKKVGLRSAEIALLGLQPKPEAPRETDLTQLGDVDLTERKEMLQKHLADVGVTRDNIADMKLTERELKWMGLGPVELELLDLPADAFFKDLRLADFDQLDEEAKEALSRPGSMSQKEFKRVYFLAYGDSEARFEKAVKVGETQFSLRARWERHKVEEEELRRVEKQRSAYIEKMDALCADDGAGDLTFDDLKNIWDSFADPEDVDPDGSKGSKVSDS